MIRLVGNASIVLPLPPKALDPNARPSRWGKIRAKSKYRKQVAEAGIAWIIDRYGCLAKPNFRQERVRLVYQFGRRAKRRDPDNLIAWAKAAIDGLVDAGIFADDSQLTYDPPTQTTGVDLPSLIVEIVSVGWKSEATQEDKPPKQREQLSGDDVGRVAAALAACVDVLESFSLTAVVAIGNRESRRVAALSDARAALDVLGRS